jgi:hypothetical protein
VVRQQHRQEQSVLWHCRAVPLLQLLQVRKKPSIHHYLII